MFIRKNQTFRSGNLDVIFYFNYFISE